MEDPKKRDKGGGGRVLALIPVTVGLVFFLLLMPHAAPPDTLPLPQVDARALSRTMAEDDERAGWETREGLPPVIRALGSAIREMNLLQVRGGDDSEAYHARTAIGDALEAALAARVDSFESPARAIVQLRAVQMKTFLDQVKSYEKSGSISPELEAVGGNFIARAEEAGWAAHGKVLLREEERRVAFKISWNATVGVEGRQEFAPTMEETRTLYSFYFTHPHPGEADRNTIASLRRGAKTEADCNAIAAREQNAIGRWRAEKIARFSSMDPDYPKSFALGVQYYWLGRYPSAAEAFRDHLRSHPNGPWTLRARNHLKAALSMNDE